LPVQSAFSRGQTDKGTGRGRMLALSDGPFLFMASIATRTSFYFVTNRSHIFVSAPASPILQSHRWFGTREGTSKAIVGASTSRRSKSGPRASAHSCHHTDIRLSLDSAAEAPGKDDSSLLLGLNLDVKGFARQLSSAGRREHEHVWVVPFGFQFPPALTY